jgi:hypothetical protein
MVENGLVFQGESGLRPWQAKTEFPVLAARQAGDNGAFFVVALDLPGV